jgi:hypothetical protein
VAIPIRNVPMECGPYPSGRKRLAMDLILGRNFFRVKLAENPEMAGYIFKEIYWK